VTPTHSPSRKESKELPVFTRQKNGENLVVGAEIGLVTPRSEVPMGALSHANASPAKLCLGERFSSSSSRPSCFENLGDGSIWVLNHIMEFCEKMGLEVGGKDH